MQSLNHFIVRVSKTHNDTVTVAGGVEIYINPKWNPFDHRICFGEIVSAPSRHYTGAVPGDILFFHHHVTSSENLKAGDDLYMVMYDSSNGYQGHAIAYRRKADEQMCMLADWVFMTPVPDDNKDEVTSTGIITELAIHNKPKRRAVIHTPSEELLSYGVKNGDIVGFDKNSDYKMTLDNGDVVYRMKAKDISYVEVEE